MEPLKPLKRYHDLADPQARPRYTGIPTFFRTPATEDLGTGLDGAEIGIAGVPFDGGVTNRSGARHGPREVRNQSTLLRRFNVATGVAPFEDLRVRDLGDAWIEEPFELATALEEVETFARRVAGAGVALLAVGGDHSISLPLLRGAASRTRPLGMVHVDAHCDTGDDYLGSRFHHGAPFRRAVEEGLLDPKRVIQIGIRGTSSDRDLWRFSRESGMRVMPMDEFEASGPDFAIAEAKRVIGDGPAYLSFDIDSLDPVYAPGTGTPEAGGMTTREALRLLRGLTGLDFVAGDLVEVSPPFDVGGLTAFHGASVLFEILCLIAVPRKRRKGVA